ncbi:uncharacterized protein LOC131211257 [Anopheles bellator]|uniref:uncharacterized protein LOC131211257 n=1 Tax=Anopheles bellator TaxID=139047 RepID=UPI0026471765|nr:uncharacterized protein LOC131211257 [Anopheles bellator]
MKLALRLVGTALLLVPLAVRADPGVIGVQDARKTRTPSSGPTSYNTIAPVIDDSETLSKLQNQVAPPTVQIPLKPSTAQVPEPSVFHTVAPPSLPSPYLRQPPQSVAQGQYYVAMVPQAAGNHMLAPATTPLIMQYINPQGQPTGGLQYIQLLRPVVYPYGNQYLHPGYLQPQQQQQQHQAVHLSASGASSSPYNVSPTPPPTTTTTTQAGFVPFQPASVQPGSAFAHYTPSPSIHYGQPAQAAPYSSGPVGQYSSPVMTYYPHRFLINPSSDLNFNTNEYVPSHGDGAYLKGVKSIRA